MHVYNIEYREEIRVREIMNARRGCSELYVCISYTTTSVTIAFSVMLCYYKQEVLE